METKIDITKQKRNIRAVSTDVDVLVKDYLYRHGLSNDHYGDGLHAVLELYPVLKYEYTQS